MTEPILAASACIWRGGQVLLIKRGKLPGKDLWSLPGGKIEVGETAMEAALRELFEETQVRADLLYAMGPFEIRQGEAVTYMITCFAGLYVSGEALAGSDAAEVAWVYPQALGALELSPNIAQTIEEVKKRLEF